MPHPVHAVPLPAGAEPPIRVFVNGEQREEGDGFTVAGAMLRFDPPLRARPRLGVRRKAMLLMGIGVYGDLKGDSLDVQYQAGGATRVVTIPLVAESPPG